MFLPIGGIIHRASHWLAQSLDGSPVPNSSAGASDSSSASATNGFGAVLKTLASDSTSSVAQAGTTPVTDAQQPTSTNAGASLTTSANQPTSVVHHRHQRHEDWEKMHSGWREVTADGPSGPSLQIHQNGSLMAGGSNSASSTLVAHLTQAIAAYTSVGATSSSATTMG